MDADARSQVLNFAADVKMLRMWIEHWQDDVASGLKPTATSLQNARDDAEKLERKLIDFGFSDA